VSWRKAAVPLPAQPDPDMAGQHAFHGMPDVRHAFLFMPLRPAKEVKDVLRSRRFSLPTSFVTRLMRRRYVFSSLLSFFPPAAAAVFRSRDDIAIADSHCDAGV